MKGNFLELGITDLKKRFPIKVSDNLSDDFFISDIRYSEDFRQLLYPCRFDGFMGVFCLKGSFRMEINIKEYDISDGTLVIYVPGNIVRVSRVDPDDARDFHFVVIAASRQFLSSARLDLTRLFEEALVLLKDPCIHLSGEELLMFGRYLKLIYRLSTDRTADMREAVSALISSAFHYSGSIWKNRIEEASLHELEEGIPRSRIIFEDFMKLVSEYHTTERGMAFYADKLCLTPKYLSKVVKDASGRSGPEWIDSYVIMEAKNMLRYSDMPIKEIVYRLNFKSPSIFNKYFRLHTGMTPSEFRK